MNIIAAERRGQELRLISDLRVYATTGWLRRSRTGQKRK